MADNLNSSASISSYNYNIDLTKCTFPILPTKKRSRFKNLYNFPNIENMDDLPKLSKEECYWHHLFQKKGALKYSKEYIRAYITRKIEKIVDYFDRLQTNRLKEREIEKKKPQNFFGPYFPSPNEIQVLESLDIVIGWEIPAKHKKLVSERKGYITLTKEKAYLVKRWQKFQKKYKIYDLRPLLGVRCGTYKASTGFTFFRMINNETRHKFLQFMGKGLPNKGLYYIEKSLIMLCDNFHDGRFDLINKKTYPHGKEFCCIVELYDQYGIECTPILELIIGKHNRNVYFAYISNMLVMKHIPIKCSAWQKEEDLTIIKNLYNNKSKLEIFNEIKTRTPWMIKCREIQLKKDLALIQTHLPINGQKLKQWTDKDNIKLITLVYNSKAENLRDVDWVEIAERFEGFCNYTLREKFYFLMKTRVPNEKQKCFDEALEFLKHNVTPIYKIKHTQQKKLRKNLSYVKDLCRSSKEALALSQYFNIVDLRDNENETILLSDKEYDSSLDLNDKVKEKNDIITRDREIVLLSD